MDEDQREQKDSGERGVSFEEPRLADDSVTTPAPALLVFIDATISQLSVLGLYISAEWRYAFPLWPPTANKYRPRVVSPTPPLHTFIGCTNCQVSALGSYLREEEEEEGGREI